MQDSTTLRNIEAISEVEKGALADGSLSAHIGDRIATEAGRMWFIIFMRSGSESGSSSI
jgi:hypothetical protein